MLMTICWVWFASQCSTGVSQSYGLWTVKMQVYGYRDSYGEIPSLCGGDKTGCNQDVGHNCVHVWETAKQPSKKSSKYWFGGHSYFTASLPSDAVTWSWDFICSGGKKFLSFFLSRRRKLSLFPFWCISLLRLQLNQNRTCLDVLMIAHNYKVRLPTLQFRGCLWSWESQSEPTRKYLITMIDHFNTNRNKEWSLP